MTRRERHGRPRHRTHRETARDGTGRTIVVATTACGFRWDADDHHDPLEREAPTTAFGRAFAEACREIVGPFSERTGRTFMHGGCAMLADAASSWSEGRLRPFAVLFRGIVDHVVASDGRSFVDCDGRFDRKGFLRKCLVLDGDDDVQIERVPWRPSHGTIARDAEISAEIAVELRRLLGAPCEEPWRRRV